jgi:hypothetical protein
VPAGSVRYGSNDPSEAYDLFDVATSPVVLSGGGGGAASFNDLGSGTSYGSLVATGAIGPIVDIPLNAAGLSFLTTPPVPP